MKPLKQQRQELLEHNLLKFCSIQELEKLNQQITNQEQEWLTQKRQETENLYIHYLNKESKKDIYRYRLPDNQQFPSTINFDRMWQLVIDELLEELKQ